MQILLYKKQKKKNTHTKLFNVTAQHCHYYGFKNITKKETNKNKAPLFSKAFSSKSLPEFKSLFFGYVIMNINRG